jgi:hypothetical protein
MVKHAVITGRVDSVIYLMDICADIGYTVDLDYIRLYVGDNVRQPEAFQAFMDRHQSR